MSQNNGTSFVNLPETWVWAVFRLLQQVKPFYMTRLVKIQS